MAFRILSSCRCPTAGLRRVLRGLRRLEPQAEQVCGIQVVAEWIFIFCSGLWGVLAGVFAKLGPPHLRHDGRLRSGSKGAFWKLVGPR